MVILKKLVLASSKTHMHSFNKSTTGMQGFKKIHWKLWGELITKTYYPMLKANLKIV